MKNGQSAICSLSQVMLIFKLGRNITDECIFKVMTLYFFNYILLLVTYKCSNRENGWWKIAHLVFREMFIFVQPWLIIRITLLVWENKYLLFFWEFVTYISYHCYISLLHLISHNLMASCHPYIYIISSTCICTIPFTKYSV